MRMLRELDPAATEERGSKQLKRRQYKYDGYNKLKPYKLSIHGAVDRFSWKIFRLEFCKSYNNPINPACIFVEAVKEFRFCPNLRRIDAGTENGPNGKYTMCTDVLRENTAAQKCGLQLQLRGLSCTGRLIDFFKEKMIEGGFVTSSHLRKEVVWFSFSNMHQRDLSKLKML